jgi:hypothetical protein
MDIGLHHRTERRIYHAMPLQRLLSRELARRDAYVKVAATISGAGMPGVPMAVIGNLEVVRRKYRLETTANRRDTISAQGTT